MSMPGQTASIEQRHGWYVVAASFALIALGNASYYISVVALKPIALANDWPRQVASLGYSLTMLGAGVGGIFMGRWCDRSGMTGPLLTGICAVSIGCLALSQVTTATGFLLVHGVFLGLAGNAAFYGPLLANTSLWFDRRRGIAVGIVAAGQGMAGGVWSPVFRWTVDEWGWRATYQAYGILVACALLPLVLVLRRPAPGRVHVPRGSPPPPAVAVLGISSAAMMAALCAAIVACCIAMSIPIVHLVAHASDIGIGFEHGARILSVALLCALVSRLAWGHISDRIGGLNTLFLTSLTQAAALGLFAMARSEAALLATAVLFGLGYGGLVPAYTVFVREVFPPRGIGARVGTVVLFGTIGMALGGWLAGHVFDTTGGYQAAFLLGLACNLVNLVILAGIVGLRRRQPHASTA